MIQLDLDMETHSLVDLKTVGLDRYARDPSTKVLMIAYQIDAGDGLGPSPVRIVDLTLDPMPPKLREMLEDPKVRKIAHNAAFEIAMCVHVLGIKTRPEDWWCTMIMALSLGLPAQLASLVRDALQLPRQFHKDARGDALMRLFSFPKSTATRETHPVEWAEYMEYCRQDVVAEAKVFKVLRKYIPNMGLLFDRWCLGEKINRRGLPVDMEFIASAQHLADISKAEYKKVLKQASLLDNPNSTKQVLAWLTERGYPFASIAKNRVKIATKDFKDDIGQDAHDFIALRLESNKTSLAKYAAIKRAAWRGRLRGTFQYLGAAATGRYAGRILGQNMPRPWDEVEDFLPECRKMIEDRNLDDIKFYFGKPLEVLSSSIRSAIATKPGKKLIVADYASIELCVIAWWTQCQFWTEVVESGQDAYKAFAVRWFGIAYDAVTKALRKLSKPPALGCFAPETKILTKRGWIPIIGLRADDEVFDGVEFVTHGGVVAQGRKEVIDLYGVIVTPDHLVLCGEGEWRQAQRVALETPSIRSATSLARGPCSKYEESRTPQVSQAGSTGASADTAGENISCGKATWRKVKVRAAWIALTEYAMKTGTPFTGVWVSTLNTLSGCLTVFTRCRPGALAATGQTLSMPVEASNVSSRTQKSLSATRSPLSVGTSRSSTLTEKKTTATTKQETSGSSRAHRTNGTNEPTVSLSTKTVRMLRKTFTSLCALITETYRRLLGRLEKGLQAKRSSTGNKNAEVRTVYDVLNAGPRNRFAVLTGEGPVIVHNCGYRMGPGRETGVYPDTEKTGLWGYSANMGVDMTKQQCKDAVRIYRELSPEIVQAWYDVENAALECVKTGEPQRAGLLSFDMKAPFLRMRLPSGRYIHYCRPRIEMVEIEYEVEDPDTGEITIEINKKVGLTYERLSQASKKWVRRSQHGGRFAEQATQGIALDLLQDGIENADRAGYCPVAHYHDEILCEVDDDDETKTLAGLIKEMIKLKPWAQGMHVRAEGYEANFYRK